MATVRYGQGDGQARPSQIRRRGPNAGCERAAGHQSVAVIDEVTEAGGPALRVDAGRFGEVVAVPLAHPVEVAPLAARGVVVVAFDDVAHDLDAGRRAPQPALLRGEDAVAVEVDASVPGWQEGSQRGEGAGVRPRGVRRGSYRQRGERDDQRARGHDLPDRGCRSNHTFHRAPIPEIVPSGGPSRAATAPRGAR